MADVKLNPYLAFRSNAREAMEFYKSVFGGELTVQTFAEGMPPDRLDPAKKDLIMHAVLETDDITIMASDAMKDGDIVDGTNVSLSISGTDGDKLKKYFEGLGEGGKITEPLKKAPWGDEFGMLTDKYGIHWLVNITQQS